MDNSRLATKRTLASLSFAIERIARGAGPGAVVVALFQSGPYFAPMVKTYEELAGGASVVIGYAGEGPLVSGATHVALGDDEALAGFWGVVLLGATVGAYVVGRDLQELDPTGRSLESRRRFDSVWGFDRAGAALQARWILSELGERLPAHVSELIESAADNATQIPPTVAEVSLGRAAVVLASCLDDTQRSLEAAALRLEGETQLATRDPLTGLVNREGMERWLGGSSVDGLAMPPLGVVMIDLDGFKIVNDTHGHEVGDDLLRAVAGALESSTRAGDIVTRWGGDEFVVLCPGLEGRALRHMAQRLVRSVSLASVDGVSVGASAGTQSSRFRPLPLQEADAAMYEAKRAGGKRVTAAG